MGFASGKNTLPIVLFVVVSSMNEFRLSLVNCQDEDGNQCMPKATFEALLRHPEVSSNLAAYSRTARLTEDGTSRNDMAHLKALTEENDDTEICIPGRVYLQLLKDPIVRGDLKRILDSNAHRSSYFLRRSNDEDDLDLRDHRMESEKRSIAMLAKNDDLPISLQDRIIENAEEEEMRAIMAGEQAGQNGAEAQDYVLSSSGMDVEGFLDNESMDKRNVGTLARDFALPSSRRNIASVIRDYDQTRMDNRDRLSQFVGKRNVASLVRTSSMPQSGKRNVASIARDYGLPYGKRYVGSLARTSDFPVRGQRSIASLARNSDLPGTIKRGIFAPGSVILRALSRHGRSLTDQLIDSTTQGERSKRQIVFSDEYPLPVVQNTNVYDYEELMDALGAAQYPNAEKRFMETGTVEERGTEVGHIENPERFRASKRHIGALARLGWLPSLRSARFSRSPRYLVSREDSPDGTSTDYSSNSSTRSLRPNFNPRTRYIQALHGDCGQGYERFLLLPTTNNYFHQKLPSSLRSKTF